FFFSSRRRHTRFSRDWSSDVCSSDLGEIRMAFPGPIASATSSDDVRGLGAVLYLLLTGRWALEGGPEGATPAPIGQDGSVVPPRSEERRVGKEGRSMRWASHEE